MRISVLSVVVLLVAVIALFVAYPHQATQLMRSVALPTNIATSSGRPAVVGTQGRTDILGIRLGMSLDDATAVGRRQGCNVGGVWWGSNARVASCGGSALLLVATEKNRIYLMAYRQTLATNFAQFEASISSTFGPFIVNPKCDENTLGFMMDAVNHMLAPAPSACLIRVNGDVLSIAADPAHNEYYLFYGNTDIETKDSGLSHTPQF